MIYIVIILVLLYLILSKGENLCVQRTFGAITDVPYSTYVNANTALVADSSLGQAPLGDPRYWIPNRSPITQGQYGLYENTLPIEDTQPFDRSTLIKAASEVPVYTDKPLPAQCTAI